MCVLSISDAPWTVLLANIEPESTGVTVGGLIPARSYQFRLCAVNDVGRGQFSKETDRWVLHLAVMHLLNVKNIARRLCFFNVYTGRETSVALWRAFTVLEQAVLPRSSWQFNRKSCDYFL